MTIPRPAPLRGSCRPRRRTVARWAASPEPLTSLIASENAASPALPWLPILRVTSEGLGRSPPSNIGRQLTKPTFVLC